MRAASPFPCRARSAILLKVVIFLSSAYSISLLLQTVNHLAETTTKSQKLLASERRILHGGRKASLQLTWVHSKDELNNKAVEKIPNYAQWAERIKNDNGADRKLDTKLNASISEKRKKITSLGLMIATDKTDYEPRTTGGNENNARRYKQEDLQRRKEDLTSNRRRYIFAFRYYEQLAMATNNLIALASLAKHYNREIVTPFVNNSRMNGVRYQISKQRRISKFVDMDRYFDMQHVNTTLQERGYAALANFSDFISDCKSRIEVMVHFLYFDKFSQKDAWNWFSLKQSTWKSIRLKAAKNNGWTPCDFLRNSGMEALLEGATVDRYICVDPEIITSAKELERLVFKDASCVSIFQWKGNGTNRTHFPLPKSILEPLRPSDLRHDSRLIEIARHFVKHHLKRPFLAIHIRAERHLLWKGLDPLLKCIKKLTRKIFDSKKHYNAEDLFIATDLPTYGSDTFHSSKSKDRLLANRYLIDSLKHPMVFKPELYGIHDRGEIAIIEMQILSLGKSLYTLGGGNFHDWIVDLFLFQNVEDRSLVHKVCVLR